MRMSLHTRHQRLLIAHVRGIVARHAEHPPVDTEAAVAEIHEITDEPHLLGHAWSWEPRYAVHTDPWMEEKNRILTAAGADPQHPFREIVC